MFSPPPPPIITILASSLAVHAFSNASYIVYVMIATSIATAMHGLIVSIYITSTRWQYPFPSSCPIYVWDINGNKKIRTGIVYLYNLLGASPFTVKLLSML